jgi:hypothetical protein
MTMIATRHNGSALLKSQIGQLEYRLREVESTAVNLRTILDQLKRQAEVVEPPPPQVVRAEVIRRVPEITYRTKVVVMRKRGKPKVFTDEVLASIPVWIEQGRTKEWIAGEIGCTMNSLQASCSKRGISLWPKHRPRFKRVEVVLVKEEA